MLNSMYAVAHELLVAPTSFDPMQSNADVQPAEHLPHWETLQRFFNVNYEIRGHVEGHQLQARYDRTLLGQTRFRSYQPFAVP